MSVMARLETTFDTSIDAGIVGGGIDPVFELGLKYCTGRDVEVDLVEAHKWFNIAAMRGNVEARRYRQELASEMTKLDVLRAQKLAREWLTRH